MGNPRWPVLVALAALLSDVILIGHPSPAPLEAASASSEVIISAETDATIDSGSPHTNYGSAETLQVSGRLQQRILLRFDLAASLPTGAIIDSARLGFYLLATSGEARVQFIVAPLSAGWNEGTVTWNNAPAATTPTSEPFWVAAALDSWQDEDVTPVVQALWSGANQGMLVRAVEGTPLFSRTFESTERVRGTHPPRLIVNYHLPATPTCTPTRTATHTP